MKIRITLFYLSFVLLAQILIQTPSLAEDDWQSWGSVNVEYKLDPQTRLIWNPVWRLRDDLSESFYRGSRQGIGYKASGNLDLAAHYFYLEEKNTSGKWGTENRLELQPTLKWKYAGFDLSDRNRFEYRDLETENKWRYRNQIKLSRSLSIRGFAFSPYISEEIYFDFKKDEWSQYRSSFGVTKKLSENVTLDVYFLIRNDKTGNDWKGTDVIGTSLNLSF